jgi:hypothetical protein
MTSATIFLNKKSYPLMMHLSISRQHGIFSEQPAYDPATQSSTFSTSMANSWCTRANSSSKDRWFGNPDDDQKEDD